MFAIPIGDGTFCLDFFSFAFVPITLSAFAFSVPFAAFPEAIAELKRIMESNTFFAEIFAISARAEVRIMESYSALDLARTWEG